MDSATKRQYLVSRSDQSGFVKFGSPSSKLPEESESALGIARRIATAASHGSSGERSAMDAKPFKTAYELADMIVARASALHGPWPAGMTMFIFEDAYGWSASISRPASEVENFYRIRTLDLIAMLRSRYDLASPRLSSTEYFSDFDRFRIPLQSSQPQGGLRGKRSATRQSGSQETKKGKDQGNCRGA